MSTVSLVEIIDSHVREGELYEKLDNGKVRCYACGHRCVIFEGQRGICKVRYNQEGKLMVPTDYVAALQCDPTEKKPFFHVLPGSSTLTFGMLGCDFHCGYCQNWLTSQALRDPVAVSEPS
ncbi:MAG: AmmeMemoRadiSam system radical SAM enzyme, partial [Acidobacteria bacterium]|nr:AmmeMemoRadiSam system radical SAM enzyme [Acidobacteriota bacterium]